MRVLFVISLVVSSAAFCGKYDDDFSTVDGPFLTQVFDEGNQQQWDKTNSVKPSVLTNVINSKPATSLLQADNRQNTPKAIGMSNFLNARSSDPVESNLPDPFLKQMKRRPIEESDVRNATSYSSSSGLSMKSMKQEMSSSSSEEHDPCWRGKYQSSYGENMPKSQNQNLKSSLEFATDSVSELTTTHAFQNLKPEGPSRMEALQNAENMENSPSNRQDFTIEELFEVSKKTSSQSETVNFDDLRGYESGGIQD